MTIPQEERNKRIVDSGRMSSRPDIKAFALSILQDEGLDPALVNFKDDMVGIGSFKKLVFAVYDAGYKDGLEENSTIRGKKKEDRRAHV